jgi:hypothetical protein
LLPSWLAQGRLPEDLDLKAEPGAAPAAGSDRPAQRCRGGAPRGRARLRYWRAERLRKGVPVLPRFLLAWGGSGGAPGCGDPHQRPRGAPFPRKGESVGRVSLTRTPSYRTRKARVSGRKPYVAAAGNGGALLFDIVKKHVQGAIVVGATLVVALAGHPQGAPTIWFGARAPTRDRLRHPAIIPTNNQSPSSSCPRSRPRS